jgi:hypothetical protein
LRIFRVLYKCPVLAGFLFFPALCHAQAPAGTTTTLALLPGSSVNSGTTLTLTATVVNNASQPVLHGAVLFCNAAAASCTGPAVLGTAQLLGSGAAEGTASVKLRLGVGSHSVVARFTGTKTYSASISAAKSLTVNGNSTNASSVFLYSTGGPGNYTLTATAGFFGTPPPTGNISFFDSTHGNLPLGQAPLAGPATYSYGQPLGYATAGDNNPQFTAVGDFNGDGIPDIGVVDYYLQNVTMLMGNGDGTFQLGQSFSLGANPTSVAVGDLNGDGNLDLVVANSAGGDSGSISVLLGNGDGTFQPQTQYFTGSITSPDQVVIGDFNGDGVPDLAVRLPSLANSVAIFIGVGDGTFLPQVNYSLGGSATYDGAPSLVAADFNNDGKLDLLDNYSYTALDSGGVLRTYTALTMILGNGDGTFQAPVFLPVDNSYNPDSITAGDFNGDGNIDIAAVATYGDTLGVMLGKGDGTFQPSVDYNTAIICHFCGSGISVSSLAQGDFNGLGKTDLIMTYSPGYLEILSGNGDGTFQTPATFSFGVNGPVMGPLALADFNGDGVTDIAEPGMWVTNSNTIATGAVVALGDWTWTATLNNVAVQGANTLDHQLPPYCCLAEASYGGDANYAGSVSNGVPLTSNSTLIPTTTVLAARPAVYAAPGQTVTLTATVSPSSQDSLTAGGQVTFFDGSTQIGSAVTLSTGQAVMTTASLGLGAHSLTAVYSGDGNFDASTSTPVPLTIVQPGFTLSLTPAAATIRQGQTAQSQLTVTPTGGLIGTVTFSCSSLPDYSACSFTPLTVTADGSGSPLTAEVFISSFGANAAVARGSESGTRPTGLLAILGLPFGLVAFFWKARGRDWHKRLLLALMALPLLMGALSACGVTNCCSVPATPAGVYAVTVTGTSSSAATSQSAVLTLTITQ